MREYWDWQQEGGPLQVRIHRRVLGGIEREGAGEFSGILLGTVSPPTRELLVEDFVRIIPGDDLDRLEESFAGQGPMLLSTVGYFRADTAPEPQFTGEDRSFFAERSAGQPRVLLLLNVGGDMVRVADVLVEAGNLPREGAPAAPAHRVLFRAAPPPIAEPVIEEPNKLHKLRRLVMPSLAVAFGLGIGAVAYLTLQDDKPRAAAPLETIRVAPPTTTPTRTPTPAPAPVVPAPVSEADRAILEPHANRAEVQREVRAVLDRWRAAILKRDIDTYASMYAPASRDTISDEMHAMTKQYGHVVVYTLRDITVAPLDGNHAIVNFRKTWVTATNKYAGEQREQVKFERLGEGWRITSEQPLKTIWMRKK